MNEDGRKVELLLRSSLEYLPTVTNSIYQAVLPGESATQDKDCHACGGRGTATRKSDKPCAVCQGTGVEQVDSYTGKTSTERHDEARRTRTVPCDSCGGNGAHGNGRRCRHCEGGGVRVREDSAVDTLLRACAAMERVRQGVEAEEAAARLQARRESLCREGSYAELDAAMRRLSVAHPAAHSLVLHWLVYDEPRLELGRGVVQDALDQACELMAAWMTKGGHTIRVPAWAKTQQAQPRGRWANSYSLGQRNTAIREANAAGESVRSLADRYGITRQAVEKVLRRRAA